MNLSLTDEQRLLKDSLEGWLANWDGKTGERQDPWVDFAEMGWLGASLPSEYGGYNFGPLEQLIIAEAFGRHHVISDYFSTILLGAGLLTALGSDKQKQEWLPLVAEGKARLSVAYAERTGRFDLTQIRCQADDEAGRVFVSGEKIVTYGASAADRLIVVARSSGAPGSAEGISLYLVDPKAEGVELTTYATLDGSMVSDIRFDRAEALEMIGPRDGAYEKVIRVLDHATALLVAEGVGLMDRLLAMTLEYVKIRRQFGKAIGDFQVIQHRIVDMRVELDCTRMAATLACSLAESDRAERIRAVAAAKVQLAKAAKMVGQNAIQLHGGIGMTEELPIGRHFRRLRVLQTLLGDADFHRRRFAQAS
jgi:alkylation response protein AidB-like acyl-CoA dehydrogenase